MVYRVQNQTDSKNCGEKAAEQNFIRIYFWILTVAHNRTNGKNVHFSC